MVTLIEAGVTCAAVTLIPNAPEVAPSVAVTVTAPALSAVRTPKALTNAMVESELFHVTCVVRVAVQLSLYVPVAVSCRDEPAFTVFVEAVMLIDDRLEFWSVKERSASKGIAGATREACDRQKSTAKLPSSCIQPFIRRSVKSPIRKYIDNKEPTGRVADQEKLRLLLRVLRAFQLLYRLR